MNIYITIHNNRLSTGGTEYSVVSEGQNSIAVMTINGDAPFDRDK